MAGMRIYQEQLPVLYPHTLAGLQKLVPAMADVSNDAGKKTWFGKDKGAIAYAKFLQSLRQTIIGLLLDGQVRESSSDEDVVAALETVLNKFSMAYPNWTEAYRFANYFFSADNKADYIATITRLRS